MKVIKPKFQPKNNRKKNGLFNLMLYTQGEDPYESPPPEDEFSNLEV